MRSTGKPGKPPAEVAEARERWQCPVCARGTYAELERIKEYDERRKQAGVVKPEANLGLPRKSPSVKTEANLETPKLASILKKRPANEIGSPFFRLERREDLDASLKKSIAECDKLSTNAKVPIKSFACNLCCTA